MHKDSLCEGVDHTPAQMIAYQLGWMKLIIRWDTDELNGKEIITPAPEYKWNALGRLYQSFYEEYADYSLGELQNLYKEGVTQLINWLNGFADNQLFSHDVRRLASSPPSKWPIWKWVHINTVAPFKSFRSKIRKWKRLTL